MFCDDDEESAAGFVVASLLFVLVVSGGLGDGAAASNEAEEVDADEVVDEKAAARSFSTCVRSAERSCFNENW